MRYQYGLLFRQITHSDSQLLKALHSWPKVLRECSTGFAICDEFSSCSCFSYVDKCSLSLSIVSQCIFFWEEFCLFSGSVVKFGMVTLISTALFLCVPLFTFFFSVELRSIKHIFLVVKFKK